MPLHYLKYVDHLTHGLLHVAPSHSNWSRKILEHLYLQEETPGGPKDHQEAAIVKEEPDAMQSVQHQGVRDDKTLDNNLYAIQVQRFPGQLIIASRRFSKRPNLTKSYLHFTP